MPDGSQSDVITLLVDNEFGVLTRVTALLRREGWNIRSLAVAETDDPDVSRLTVSLYRRHTALRQIIERLERQTSVREVLIFTPESQVAQELCLARLDASDPSAIEALRRDYELQFLGEGEGEILLSLRCAPDRTGEFVRRCKEIGLREIARTGAVALSRGRKEEEN